jgi:hypothetical protein
VQRVHAHTKCLLASSSCARTRRGSSTFTYDTWAAHARGAPDQAPLRDAKLALSFNPLPSFLHSLQLHVIQHRTWMSLCMLNSLPPPSFLSSHGGDTCPSVPILLPPLQVVDSSAPCCMR